MEYTILILLLPLLSFLFLGLAGMKLKPVVAGAIGTAVLAVVALLSYCTAFEYFSAGRDASGVFPTLVPWNTVWLPISRTLHIDLGILLDPISVMMLVGIGLLSLDGQGGGLNPGDILTLICGFLFAGHIIAVEQCQKKTNTYALIVLQFAFCALYAGLYNRIFERGMPLAFTPGSIGGLLYIAVFSTTIGMSLQNIGQSMAPASHAVILLSLESVFGVLFSCLLLGEKVTLQMGVGFAIIFAALLVSELAPKKSE